MDDRQVTFRYKDYRANGVEKTLTLAADEFIRRFLLHVLPDGFQRIRYFGFLGNRHRQAQLARCRALLGMALASPHEARPTDSGDHVEALINCVRVCPKCHATAMRVVEQLPRVAPPAVPAPDSS
jgi:hypothetical protein